MPPRSKVLSLPADVKEWLDSQLVGSGFQGYSALAEELAEKGYEISKSALGRYGQVFEQRMQGLAEVTEQAKAAVKELGDDEDALGAASIAFAKQKIFSALVDFQIEPGETTLKELTLALSRVTKAGVAVNKYRQDVKARAATAAEEVVDVVQANGLSDDAAEQIRAKILGIAQ